MRNREILKSEAKIFWKDQTWGQAKSWGQAKIGGQAKFEAISESRPGQWGQASLGQVLEYARINSFSLNLGYDPNDDRVSFS